MALILGVGDFEALGKVEGCLRSEIETSDYLAMYGYDGFNRLPLELVSEMILHIQGEELPVALANTRLLEVARSIHEE